MEKFFGLEEYLANRIYSFNQRFGEMCLGDIEENVSQWIIDYEEIYGVKVNVE